MSLCILVYVNQLVIEFYGFHRVIVCQSKIAILQKYYLPAKYTIDAERCRESGLRKFIKRRELGKNYGIAK